MKKWLSLILCLLFLSILPLSVYAAWPYVKDDADLLTDAEQNDLIESCIQFQNDTGMELAFVTVNSLNGKSAVAYADDYFDEHFGADGILLLISMKEREWYISTAGSAIEAFDDVDLMGMEDGLMKYLPDGQYYNAFRQFLSDAEYYATNEPVSDLTASLIIAFPFGVIVAGIVLLIMRSMMNTKSPKHSAEDYLKEGSYQLTRTQDLFLYTNVTKTPRPQQNSSGSGSSIHRSSSGRSHGGRGGKF